MATCTGPSHAEGSALLPVDAEHWYFHKSGARKGKPATPCRACHNWRKLVNKDGPHGLVTINGPEVLLVRELLDRCDSATEVERRYGIRRETVRELSLAREPVRVQKRTIQRILLALAEQRRLDRLNGATNERFRQRRVREATREQKMMEGYTQ